MKAIKADVAKVLKRLGLSSVVSVEEIGRDLAKVDTPFQSLLILGILRRILYREDNNAAEIFIPAVTNWKNYLPREDLNGMSPFEYQEKYPPGPYETECMRALIESYHQRLKDLGDKIGRDEPLPINIPEDFARFQKDFLSRIPFEQPYAQLGQNYMTYRDIIIRERRMNGVPEDKVDQIGARVFVENTAEGIGDKAARLDDAYIRAIKELDAMRRGERKRSRSRVRKIRKLFEEQEPYHRCGPEPHRFYLNYAAVVFLDEENMDRVHALLDKSLSYKPNYELALNMKKSLRRG